MAKTQDEINELLSSELFTRGIEDGYISVNDEHTTIRYNCKNQNKSRKLSNPEESVQAEAYLRLFTITITRPAISLSMRQYKWAPTLAKRILWSKRRT